MRYILLLATAALGLAGQAMADEVVSTVDGRQFLLRSDGRYEPIESKKAEATDQYKSISFEDLKLDIHGMEGQLVEVKAKVTSFGDMVMLADPKAMFDGSPIVASQDSLSREERRRILRCKTGCNVVVRGKVGQIMFQPGIEMQSLQK